MKHEGNRVGKQLGLSVPSRIDLGVGTNWQVAHLLSFPAQNF